jgi:cytochrome c
MSPHPELSTKDAQEMVSYILSLSSKDETRKLSLKDSIILTDHINQGREGSYLLNAKYTDKGANGIEPLVSNSFLSLNNPRVESEDFDEGSVSIGTSTTNEFYAYIRAVKGGYIKFNQIDLNHIEKLKFRVLPNTEGRIEVRLDSIEGPIIGSVAIPAMPGGGSSWKEFTATMEEVNTRHNLYFVFTGPEGKKQHLFDIDWIYFSEN